MKAAAALAGTAIICYLLRDVFHTVFNPRGVGGIATYLALGTWKAFRPLEKILPASRPYSGPIAMLLIILVWAWALILGWALVFWAFMPNHFIYPQALLQGRQPGFLDALYSSSISLITLGGSDMVPDALWGRMLVPVEGLMGFGIFSASVTWFLTVYPILNRRRAFANEVLNFRRMEEEEGRNLLSAETNFSSSVVHGLSQQLLVLRGDIVQFPITYYFMAVQPSRDLPAILPYALRLARRCEASEEPSVAIAGRGLHITIQQFLAVLAPLMRADERSSTVDLLRIFQRDHLREHASDERQEKAA